MNATDDFSSLEVDAATAARRLLGCVIERQVDGETIRVQIVETEAYDQNDPASHSVTGPNGRARTMFMSAGYSYVYFTYGMHYCCNVVTGAEGFGSGALIRAVEPLQGTEVLSRHRNGKTGVSMTNGPAKLCQAMGITRGLDGHDMHHDPLRLVMTPPLDDAMVASAPRVGISKAIDTQWRFYIKDNPYVSVK